MKPFIREATIDDLNTLVLFQQLMAMETELLRLDGPTLNAGVKRIFDEPSKGVYYTALWDNEMVGSLLTTFEWSDWRNQSVWWIQSVYVKPEYRRQGVFKAMFEHVHRLAMHEAEVGGLRLYVDKSNKGAQETYKKMGMNGDHYQLFELMKNF